MADMNEPDIDAKSSNCSAPGINPIPSPNASLPGYPQWIGLKFSPTGTALPYPGNTILAHLPPTSSFRRNLQDLHEDLQTQDFYSLFAFLPPSSWHMTIYEGVTDQSRSRDRLPAGLAIDAPLKVCHAHVATLLADFEHELGPAGVGRMDVVGFWPIEDGICFELKPADVGKEVLLRSLRDRLSASLGMRHPDHNTYSWHMGFAYTLRLLTAEEKARIMEYLTAWLEQEPRTFDLGVPELCVCDNMLEMRRIFYLQ